MRTHLKAPAAELDYEIDWAGWLATGETIATSSWSVPAGLEQVGDATLVGGVTTIWLAGGTVGGRYRVTNTIETSVGRIDARSFVVRVVER